MDRVLLLLHCTSPCYSFFMDDPLQVEDTGLGEAGVDFPGAGFASAGPLYFLHL